MFSRVEDMKNYWSITEEEIQLAVENLKRHNNEVFPEAILASNYYTKKYESSPIDFKDYKKLLADYFIVIEESEVNLLWARKKITSYNRVTIDHEILLFSKWLELFDN
jgi:hypothetical protein